jgi:hypothetical protein
MVNAVTVVVGLTAGIGGAAAYAAGVCGLRETARLARVGIPAWALVQAAGPGATRPLLLFATREGRVLEVCSPVPSSRSRPLPDGARVEVAYDPADPSQILLRGDERPGLEYAFLGLGGAALLAALALLSLSR